MTPTGRALGLEPQVREALSAAYRLVEKRTLFSPGESRQEFTVMTAEYIEYLLLPRLIAKLNEEAPFVRVTFRSAQPEGCPVSARGRSKARVPQRTARRGVP